MNRFWHSVFRNPTFWSGVLAGCVVAVLTLAGVAVYAQSGGDNPPPDEPAPVEPAESGAVTGDMLSPAAANAPLGVTAAISTTTTYQGLLNLDGAAANDTFDFRFRLFDAPAAGTQLGEHMAAGVNAEDGLFTAPLDFGFDAYAGQATWLEIAVRPAGGGAYETLSPRQPLTAAPLALSLPNVTSDPTTGFVGIGGAQRLTNFQYLGINQEYDGWVGMYITAGGPNGRPYYGYATDDEGSFDYAWTEYNGAGDEWRLYVNENKVFGVKSNGDVNQPLPADGLVKAAAFVECWNDGTLTLYNSFNGVNDTAVTVAPGPGIGECYIDFGFNLTDRFFQASAVQNSAQRAVTCAIDPGDNNRLLCQRWRPAAGGGGEPWSGRIMVLVY